ncbi:MAG: hypothetical protein ACI9FR_001443 [Cryomorphaceae bacterium]|jgi:hypothetical protein
MDNLLRVLIALPAILFSIIGLRFMFDPAGAADFLGMALSEGRRLSSQIGDGGGLFLGMGLMMPFGLIKSNSTWLKAPALVLIIVAVYRVLAWQIHGAALTVDNIAIELIVAALLFAGASRFAK